MQPPPLSKRNNKKRKIKKNRKTQKKRRRLLTRQRVNQMIANDPELLFDRIVFFQPLSSFLFSLAVVHDVQ